jgi:alkanesulfonate monooxygenase SsuD/methylene tetrahydromethanopterin reductase-like flavin-dependent oxidoreductase (luciferase family)
VLPLARRRPGKVARELATLDHLSGGRLTVGVGLGAPAGLEFGDFGEPTEAGVRAARLDEGLDVLTGLWTGQPVDYAGEHHRLTGVQLLPRPVQKPVPIWVGGAWPASRAPFRRAARFAGVHPMLSAVPPADQPAAIRDLLDYIGRWRDPGQPFDVAYGVETAGDGSDADRSLVRRFAEAGVTWWMEPISSWRGPLAKMRDRIRRGPPTLG